MSVCSAQFEIQMQSQAALHYEFTDFSFRVFYIQSVLFVLLFFATFIIAYLYRKVGKHAYFRNVICLSFTISFLLHNTYAFDTYMRIRVTFYFAWICIFILNCSLCKLWFRLWSSALVMFSRWLCFWMYIADMMLHFFNAYGYCIKHERYKPQCVHIWMSHKIEIPALQSG